ncbi:MAG: hypothetical protein LBP80_01855 [Treponema sp.]|nr:hypothetical protein [Treponema sp.]
MASRLLTLKVWIKKSRTKRKRLAAELRKIYGDMEEALKREQEAGNMTEVDGDKIQRMTEILHQEVYGSYTEFEEESMKTSRLSEDMRLIERLHEEIDKERRSREEERRLREETVSRERQRLRDTARNILQAGQPVEQVARWTGLPLETIRALAAQL